MKKNVMMRVAAILMVCVLATTCGISGTFAKYTTQSSVNDNARVAYWGFSAPATQDFALFNSGDAGVLNNGDGLLAPGSFDSATFRFMYTDNTAANAPEVDYTFVVTVTATADTDLLDANPNFYWVLNNTAYKTFAELQTAIEALDGNVAGNKYEAGTLPTTFYIDGNDAATHTVGWFWLFGEGDEAPDGFPETITVNGNAERIVGVDADEEDTEMGNAADLDDIAITITITATQED